MPDEPASPPDSTAVTSGLLRSGAGMRLALDAYRDAKSDMERAYLFFCDEVRAARSRGVSLDRIARELGVTKSTVQRWAKG